MDEPQVTSARPELPMGARGEETHLAEFLHARPYILKTASVAVVILVWEVYARRVDPIFLAAPSAIFRAFADLIRSGELPVQFGRSMVPFVYGLGLSLAGGIMIGLAMGKYWPLEHVLDPPINALYGTPRVALIPLVMLWFGLELSAKVVIVMSLAIFPIIINTYAGVQNVSTAHLEVARAYGATERQIFFKVLLPAALPFIMAGVRLATGLAIIGVVVAEFFTQIQGLGGMIVNFGNVFATAKMFVPIIILAALGIGLTELVGRIERWLAPWRQGEPLR